MREILFRGKRADNGEWIYGDYVKGAEKTLELCVIKERIPVRHNYLCYSETVGQYTGLTDKNGTKIFEGDIVKCTDEAYGYEFTAIIEFGNPNSKYDWGYQLHQISGEKSNTDILCWVEME